MQDTNVLTAKRIINKYNKGERNFKGVNLQGINFTNATLENADFSAANIQGTNFTNAKLRGAHFNQSTAGVTTFRKVCLSLLLLIGSIPVTLISLFLLTYIWKSPNFPSFDKMIYSIISLIAFPLFIWALPRKGVTPAFLILLGSVFVATFVDGFPSFATLINAVIIAFFWFLKKKKFATIPVALIILILLQSYFPYTGELSESIGLYLYIVAAEVTITAISVTIFGSTGIIANKGAIVVSIFAKLAILIPALTALLQLPEITKEFPWINLQFGNYNYTFGIFIGVFWGAYIAQRALSKNDEYAPFIKDCIAFSLLSKSTKFRGADLTNADFTKANLGNTDFRDATITGTKWHMAENLHFARVQGTYLQHPQVRKLVVIGEGKEKKFDNLELQGINLNGLKAKLQGARFIDTNLIEADLSEADLSETKLVRTLLDKACLTGTTLTGATVQDWRIKQTTTVNDVKCDYVYLRLPTKYQPLQKQKIQNQEDLNELIETAETQWKTIYSRLNDLRYFKNTVLREEWEKEFIKAAQEAHIPLPMYRKLFEDYCDQELLSQFHPDSWNLTLMRAEIRMERFNRLLTQMDLFPILENLGRLSILVAVIFFVLEIPQRAENSEREKAEAHYRAWETIRGSKDDRASSGRMIALQRLKKGGQLLAGLDAPRAMLSGINLSGVNLTRVNFKEANLSKANLNGANLSKANLKGADLSNADLKGADLRGADFSGASLIGADLRNIKNIDTAIFKQAKYENLSPEFTPEIVKKNQMIQISDGADLQRENLRGWDLTDSNLTNAKLQGTDLRDANLKGANLRAANLEGTLYNDNTQFPDDFNLKGKGAYKIAPGAVLKDANLINIDLKNEDLSGADLRGADLIEAQLEYTILKRALYNLSTKFPSGFKPEDKGAYKIAANANLRGANLEKACLNNEDLTGADLRNAILTGANLEGTDLKDALYNDATKFPENYDIKGKGAYRIEPGKDNDLTNANLKNQDLSGADLSGANLSHADLSGANLSGADLSGAILSRADLIGADLSGTDLSKTNLIGADLSQAKNLTVEQIQKATNRKAAIYDEKLSEKLGLSPKKK